jgi:hypothetical protein
MVLICPDLSSWSRDQKPTETRNIKNKKGVLFEKKQSQWEDDKEGDAKRRVWWEFLSIFNSFPFSFKFLSWMYGMWSYLLHHLHNDYVRC